MDVEVELSRIIINETSDQQIIVLKERHGSRPSIVVGIVENLRVDRRLKGIPPRPMTRPSGQRHRRPKATIDRIVIDDLRTTPSTPRSISG